MGDCAMARSKTLIAFDFDHTIMDINTDVDISKLAKDGRIPIEFDGGSWTDYMQSIFEFLHQQGVRQQDYTEWAGWLPFTDGMEKLIRLAGENPNFHLIIVSDSNSVFINSILENVGLSKCINRIFTNPAYFDDQGCLRIRYYHINTDCNLSEKNMCKGRILNEYLKEHKEIGRIIYVGDGKNDYCPVIRTLRKGDGAFARKGYTMEKLINKNVDRVQCDVHVWSTGEDIIRALQLDTTNLTCI